MMSPSNNSALSGFARVKEILNNIQGETIPDYQGYRAFWLSIVTFQSVELYGQRMISPPDSDDAPDANAPGPSSCCHGGDDNPAVEAVNTQPSGTVTANCWPTEGEGGSGGGSSQRSERSGIIRGLRGEYPFDGSVFPPLLWDATRRATAGEIKYIAAWIDQGCPTEEPSCDDSQSDKPQSSIILTTDWQEKTALACGDKHHKVSANSTNVDHGSVKGISVRKEISTLTPTELARYREAIACMFQYNAYWQDERSFDHWARMHANSCQHGWEQFLPWHRLYLYFFEQTLQDYDPLITLPYWAWSDYADCNESSFNNSVPDLGVIPSAYHCWLTEAGLIQLKDSRLFSDKELARLSHLCASGDTFNSGLRFLNAAKIEYSIVKNADTGTAAWSDKIRTIYNVLISINPLWFPNRWPGSAGSPASYPTKGNIDNLLALSDWADFGGGPEYDHHYGDLEKVHNGMHLFSGGSNPCFPRNGNTQWIEMYQQLGISLPADQQNRENPPYGWMTDNRITAFDPIFWAHHANVDRLWARWQELHPNTQPMELDGALAPWNLTVKDSLSVKKLGYEYMRDSFHYSTNKEVAITKFHAEKCHVGQDVLDTHKKVDIRLHRVKRANVGNVIIRLFLNSPDVDTTTPMAGNDNFVGELQTFHGSCFGGPGHCGIPPDNSRKFDQRQIHHNEPLNYRVDATQTVQRLLAKGENDLSVHMVVVGVSGEPVDDALFMDGVSLNFFD